MTNVSTIRGLLLSMSVIALAACSSDGSATANKTAAPMPPITEMDMAMETPAPQPLPLSKSDTVTPIGQPANPMAPATVSTTTTTTTTAPAGSMEERMARLEQNVGSLQNDYNRIMPAFASLNTTNERIQILLDEIEKETGKRPAVAEVSTTSAPVLKQTETKVTTTQVINPGAVSKASPPLSTPPIAAIKAEPTKPTTEMTAKPAEAETAAAVKPAAAPTTAATSASSSVNGVRIGEHGNKTRIVFDLTAKAKPEFNYDLDNTEKLLLVTMPASAWTGPETGKPSATSPLIQGWSVQKDGAAGSTLAVQLKKGAKVLSTEYLKAEGKDGPRLVVDIAPNG